MSARCATGFPAAHGSACCIKRSCVMKLRRLCASLCVTAALVTLRSPAKSEELFNSANGATAAVGYADCNAGCDDGACCGGGYRSAFYVQADVLYWDRVGNGCDQV